jgi:4-hydroxy-3-polyprenylbenzoate decarboxylase
MMKRTDALVSLRQTLDWLGNDVKTIRGEVDPVIEATAIMKRFDDGPVIVAEDVKGYPNARFIGNLWQQKERVAKLLGVDDYAQAKHRILDALKSPIPPVVVDQAPCQEVVIPREEVRPFSLFPLIQHTELDGGRFFGAGVHYIGGDYVDGKSQLSFYRMSFRGNDYASIQMIPGGHGDEIANRHYNDRIPCTVNICPPPTVELMGMGALNPVVFPTAPDEIGAAGALMGRPIELVKAKTIDAYAIAQSEWVIEGHIVPSERVWETEEAEKLGRQGEAMLHPEWARYMGRAYRARKFEISAVTHRKHKPLYFVWQKGASWGTIPFVAATYYELANRIAPGLVQDITSHMLEWAGLVIKVKKRRATDEGMQRNILAACMGIARGLRLAVVVDEDIDIGNWDDVVWAIATRVNYQTDLIFSAGGRGQAFQPAERMSVSEAVSMFRGGLGIDATVPFGAKKHFARARYPVDKVDFLKWFTEEEIRQTRARQPEAARYLGDTGYA